MVRLTEKFDKFNFDFMYRVQQRSQHILICIVQWCNVSMRGTWCGVLLLMSCHFVCLLDMERWTAEHRSFAVETYFKNNDSIVATQSIFRRQFNLGRHGKVPDGSTITRCVSSFRLTASACSRKPGGSERTVRTPEMIENAHAAVLRSPRKSARRHSTALGISDRSFRRILHQDFNFHPYKL
jgi:hypothetical protein